MFYELLNFNNDFDLIKLNNNISNKFFTLILIGIDSNYLDLNDIDINKTTEYYFNKINNLTLSKFNENFNKTNIYHLELLTNILKINLVIFDKNKNKIINELDNGYKNALYIINNNTDQFLLNQKKTILESNINEL
tara:strand:+ start:270 stop:677 length:408 start_codon:yes stop_codon:yes gene_type:complete